MTLQPEIRSDLLSKLLPIQQTLDVLPDSAATAVFLRRALSEIPGVVDVHLYVGSALFPPSREYAGFCAENEAAWNAANDCADCTAGGVRVICVPLRTVRNRYGTMLLSLDDEEVFSPYLDFVQNVGRAVATTFEARDYVGQLDAALTDVETQVAERTATLRESGEKFRDLVETVSDWAWEVDENGVYTYCSPRVRDLLGYEPQELIGKSPSDLMPTAEAARVAAIFGVLIAERKPLVALENVNLHKDGHEVVLETSGVPVFDSNGAFKGYRGVDRDITERKRAQREALEQFKLAETFFNHSVSSLVILDRNFNFLRVNEAYARACRREIGEFVGRNHFEMYPSDTQAIFEDVVRSKRPFTTFTRAFVFEDQPERGTTYWDWTLVPILDQLGEVEYLVFSLNEVTERKRAEQEQRAAALYARSLIEASLDPLVTISPAGKITDVNKSTEDVTGAARERLVGTDFADYFTEPDRARAGYQEVLERGYVRDYPLTVRHSSGHTTDVLYNASVYRNEVGELEGVFAAARDITERKLAEAEHLAHLRFLESMDRINRAVQGTNDLEQMLNDALDAALSIFDCDRAWLVYPCVPDALSFRVPMEVTKPEYPGAKILNMNVPMSPGEAQNMREALESDAPVTYTAGTERPISTAKQFGVQSQMFLPVRPKFGKPWMLGLHQCSYPRFWTVEEKSLFKEIGRRLADALTSMLIQRDLRQSEGFLSNVVENLPNMVVVKDAESLRFVRFNKAGEQLLGYTREELLGKNDYDFFPKEEADFFSAKDREVLGQKGVVDIREETITTRDKRERVLHTKKIPILDSDGKPQFLLGISEDITERKQAEAVRTQLAAIVQSSNDAIVGMDNDGVITSWNPGAEKIYGYSAQEVVGKPASIMAPDGKKEETRNLIEAVHRGETVIDVETDRIRKDGRHINVAFSLSPIRDSGGRHVGASAIVRDVTEKKQAERALHKVNRALKALSNCNQALIHATEELQLLNEICRVIVDDGGYRLAWVGYGEHDAHKAVRPVAQFGYDEGYLAAAKISWADTLLGRGPSGTAIRTGTVQVNQNFLTNQAMAPWREAARARGYLSSIALPLNSSVGILGVLTIYAAEPDAFNEVELKLLQELAADLAFGIETLRTRTAHERSAARLQRSMEATIQAVAGTVEMRDAYTAGHQRRVAELATAIARAMGLAQDRVHGVYLAAVVHDLGKIHVPAEILSKPGKLSRIELEMVKTHPEAGYEILKDVEFPWPIAQIVFQHHERLDGSGYPRGLKGDQILLEARILMVADVVEAMASHRPYRPALGIDQALQEISANAGKIYDADVALACIGLFREKAFAFTA